VKLLYIAGPFSHRDRVHGIDRNILAASEIALACWKAGWATICPHKNTAGFQHTTVPDSVWYEGDLEMLRRCDAVLLIPGWGHSMGAMNEAAEAEHWEIPVYVYDRDGIPSPEGVPA
jgi:nucleoside 2-deoxyribosyltransferase